jgi:thermitase
MKYLLILLFLIVISNSYAQELPTFVPNEVIVKFTEKVSSQTSKGPFGHATTIYDTDDFNLELVLSKYSAEIEDLELDNTNKITGNVVKEDKSLKKIKIRGDVLSAVEDLSEIKTSVEYAQPNYMYYTDSLNDPLIVDQWAHSSTKADIVWENSQGSSSITIGVIDTGVDYTHEDLKDNVVLGYDFVDIGKNFPLGLQKIEGEDYDDLDDDPMDFQGHGTHVAGLGVAVGGNNLGGSGACPKCSLMPLRAGYAFEFFGARGGAMDDAGVIKAIDHAILKKINVLVMSFGGPSQSQALGDKLKKAYDSGIILVAAAGNSGGSETKYPAGFEEVVAIGAHDINDKIADFSDYGSHVKVAMPGKDTLSTMLKSGSISNPTGYGAIDGTSMANGYAGGVAGLVLSERPDINGKDLENLLVSSGKSITDSSGKVRMTKIDLDLALNNLDDPFSGESTEIGDDIFFIFKKGPRNFFTAKKLDANVGGYIVALSDSSEFIFEKKKLEGAQVWQAGHLIDGRLSLSREYTLK